MKRTSGAIAVTGIAALLLSACGGDAEAPATSTSPTSDASATSDVATESGDSETTSEEAAPPVDPSSTEPPVRDANAELVIWTDDVRQPIVQQFADAFGAEQGITVQVQVATDVRQQFKDSTNVDQGPDVIVGAHDWLGELVQNGTVAPVQLSPELEAAFVPESIEAVKFDGQVYGVPYATESLGLIRNTALAPDAPSSMEDLVETGKALVEAGDADQVMVTPVGQAGDAYHAFPYLSAYGGGIFGTKADGGWDPDNVIVGSADSIKGGEKIAWLAEEGALNVNVDFPTMESLFAEGRTPYMVAGPWAMANVEGAGIEYAIEPIPDFEDGGTTVPFLGVQMFYVSAKAKNPIIAQEFVANYASTVEMQTALYELGDRPPALIEALDAVSATDPDIASWSAAGEGASPMPNIPAMNSVWGPLGQATADIVGGDEPGPRLEAAQEEIVTNIAGR